MSEYVFEMDRVSKCFTSYSSELARMAGWVGLRIRPEKSFWALRDVGFQLRRGESLAVIGGNGAGKSTLLRLANGTTTPTYGAVRVHGSRSSILELGLDFNADLTGIENVRLYGGLMGLGRRDLAAIEVQIREFADLGDAMDEPVRTYSTGMQARVAFALATAVRTDILIVDEVLSVGDGAFQEKSLDRIRRYQQRGTSVIFVTHGLGDLHRCFDRALWLNHGKAAMTGATSDVVAAYIAAQAQPVRIGEQTLDA